MNSTNITANNTEIKISSIGNGDDFDLLLSCHTDLKNCCRRMDTTGPEPAGEWYFPNGSVVTSYESRGLSPFYRVRSRPQTVSLVYDARRNSNIRDQVGQYCCKIPTSLTDLQSEVFCAKLGKWCEKCMSTLLLADWLCSILSLQ